MLPHNHSISFDFEELQPEIEGVRLEVYFNGTAELENDGDGFFVRSIAIDATAASPFERSIIGRRVRKPTYLLLDQASILDNPEKGALFSMLSRAIYASEAAQEAWASEREAA